MKVEVTFLTRRGADAIMRKSQIIDVDLLRFGRGTENEVQLTDIRVDLAALTVRIERRAPARRPRRPAALTAAALDRRPPDVRQAAAAATRPLYVRQVGDSPLRVNGETTREANVGLGDEMLLGPYKLVATAPPEGCDYALTVELVQPLSDSLDQLLAQNRMGLEKAGLSRRRFSWWFFILFAFFGLVLPIMVSPFGARLVAPKTTVPSGFPAFVNLSWNAGELSNPHRYFAENCATCHAAAFSRVADKACLTCHAGTGNHFDAASADLASAAKAMASTSCADCHEEHRGIRGLIIRREALCTDCHRSLADPARPAGVRNVSGYPAGHPQFRATVVADAARPVFARMEIGAAEKPQDHSNLVFSHAAHLLETGFLTPQGRKIMVCADCHRPEPSGQGFLPVTFEGQCHSCHDLKFDAELPWREVPHGDAEAVKQAVADFYAHMALQGGVQDPDAPPLARRPVGTPIEQATEKERGDALAWAKRRGNDALGIVFDEKRGCAYCHVVDRAGGAFTVAPVKMLVRFLPQARFDHARHTAMSCADCHDSRHSEKSSDVLIPGIETCVTCHGSERAELKTQSTCTSCHLFHRREFGPMRQQAMAGK